MRSIIVGLAIAAVIGCGGGPVITPMAEPVRDRGSMDAAIADGVAFLVKSQQPDGNWGTGRGTRGYEVYSMVPGSHDAYRVATTALGVMALRDVLARRPKDAAPLPGARAAHDRGLSYLVHHGEARRDSGDLMYNTWAHIYALQALSLELQDRDDAEVRKAAEWQLDHLRRYETYVGGWNYYDFKHRQQVPSDGPTSFGTSEGLVAMWEAKKAGLSVPEGMIRRAKLRVEEMRKPDGSFIYGQYLQYHPMHLANQVKGSLGRTQAGHDALWLWSSKAVGEAEVRAGLDNFFREHRFIEIGRKRQYPHEAWYYTAPYYFFFGHYHAARLVERLGEAGRRDYAAKLAATIRPFQEPDGSWWDMPAWDYDRPYGTAYALMILVRC